MKVLLLNTTDILGGAARGAYRLHTGLRRMGIDSGMLVRYKLGDNERVNRTSGSTNTIGKLWFKVLPHIEALPLRLYSKRQRVTWSLQWLPNGVVREINHVKPDIVHLNWIGGLFPFAAFAQLQCPMIWTLSDMWAFTGGCHYDQECGRYRQSCGACPQLASEKQSDLSRWVWQSKQRAWRGVKFTVVAISHWLAECARASSLFCNQRIEMIPYGLDLERYRPIAKPIARDLLSLPRERKLVAFGADGGTGNPRKGAQYLQAALRRLATDGWTERVELIIFGESEPLHAADWGFRTHYLGHLHDDISLALLYSAVDVMTVPSTEEAFGQTASEAMACGTPVVGFSRTGLLDIVEHKCNGYLAEPFEAEDLARGIRWVLEDRDRWQMLSHQARRKAEREYSLDLYARRYVELYKDAMRELASGSSDGEVA